MFHSYRHVLGSLDVSMSMLCDVNADELSWWTVIVLFCHPKILYNPLICSNVNNPSLNAIYYSVGKKKPDTLTFPYFSDMWTIFEISNRKSCSKSNLLSFDIGVIIYNSSKVKSYGHFSETSRYILNAFWCFSSKFSKSSYSMQMEMEQVHSNIISYLGAHSKDFFSKCGRRIVSQKPLPPTWEKNI